MNLPYTAPKWADGLYKVPRPVSLPVFTPPLPNSSALYLLRQYFEQFRNNRSALALNTRHPNYPTYVLVNEGDTKDLGGGKERWTRTYAQIPATYSEYESFAYNFIGITNVAGINIPIQQGRLRFTWRVNSRVQYDFYLTGNTLTPTSDNYGAGVSDGNAASNGTGTDALPIDVPGNVPSLRQFLYVAQAYDNVSVPNAWIGGVYFPTDLLGAYTFPSTTQYQAMIEDARANLWNATVSVENLTLISAGKLIINPTATQTPNTPTPNSILGGQIAAEDSQLTRWMGNIWMRRSRYVLAQ